jgi:predicted GIY-YIG superfamily endonuclease
VVNAKRTKEEQEALDREEIVEREVRRQKEAYTKQRLEQIKDYERDILDQKS